MRALELSLAFGLALVACDSRAAPSDPQGGGARAEQKSKEYESCGASMHCQDDLRCFDQVCRRAARSTVGDYQAAFGAALRAKGELASAVTAYEAAIAQYDAEKVAVPPDVDCAYGAALAASKSNGDRAARVLHRCLLAVPAGSALRTQALADLATLADAGLDPLLLGAGKTAERYLTKQPAGPATDKLAVTVTPQPQPTGKGWPKVPEAIQALRPALVECWTQHNAATKKPELAVTIGLRVAYVQNPDFEDEGAFVTKLEAPGPGAGGEDACVRAAVEPALKALKLNENVNTKLTISVK